MKVTETDIWWTLQKSAMSVSIRIQSIITDPSNIMYGFVKWMRHINYKGKSENVKKVK